MLSSADEGSSDRLILRLPSALSKRQIVGLVLHILQRVYATKVAFLVSASRPQNRGVDALSLCPLLSEGPRPPGCVVSALRAAPPVARRAIGTLGNAVLCPGWEGGLDGVLVASRPYCREGAAFRELGLLPRGCLMAGSLAHLSAAPLPPLFFN